MRSLLNGIAAAGLLALGAASSLAAQKTADQARLSLGVAAGIAAGTDLWTVSGQPIADTVGLVDYLRLSRRIRSSLSVVFHGTYFPGDHWGITGEAQLLGLGTEDQCTDTAPSGSRRAQIVCNNLQGNTSAASAVALSVGAIYRVASHRVISPYARAHLGAVITQHSTIRVDGIDDTDPNDPVTVPIFTDPTRRQIMPVLGLGVGFTAAVGPGYQLRWELRDQITGVDKVTGSTPMPGLEPPHKMVIKNLITVTFGFDVVLERKRGHRY